MPRRRRSLLVTRQRIPASQFAHRFAARRAEGDVGALKGCHANSEPSVHVARRLTPIRPPVVNRQRRPVTSALFSSVRIERVASPSSPTFVSRYWLQASSLHQTPIGDLVRSVVAAPCPRNSSVPSLVQSKSSWLLVQLAPGSRKGQRSSEDRPSALRECSEGRWDSNQCLWRPGVFHEAIA